MSTYPVNLSVLARIDDQSAFARLPQRLQKLVMRRLDWAIRISEASSLSERGKLISQAALALDVSVPTVYRICGKVEDGGWRALVDGRGRFTNSGLPEEFRDWIGSLHLLNQRDTTGMEVHRQATERWRLSLRTGDPKYAIPGYASPPPAGPAGYPVGWSYDNLLKLRPTKRDCALVRQGEKRAAGYLPPVLKTRSGLKFGQVVQADDQWDDIRVVAPGMSQKVIRPLGFNFLEYLSGCCMTHTTRFRFWDAEAGRNRELSQQDFVWSAIAYFQDHGYRDDEHGTVLYCEWGTASGFNSKKLPTFADHTSFDAALAAVSKGRISVQRSGLFNKPAFAELYFRPQSSGNPNGKGAVESSFNFLRNRMASLSGATGLNRDMKPAECFGIDLHAEQMLKVWERLDERYREMICWPLLTTGQFAEVKDALYRAINSRTEHALEGWEDCGHVETQLRFTPDERSPWLSCQEVNDLPADVRAMLLAKADSSPGHVRPYRLSPADVASRHAGELTKLPDHAIPLIVPSAWARPVTVKEDRTVSIKDILMGPEPFTYAAKFEDKESATILQPGTKLLAFLNPFRPARLVICREDGAYLGTLRLQTRSGWLDDDSILEQLKERSKMESDLNTGVKHKLQGLMEHRQESKRINTRLAKGQPVLPEDVAAARSESGKKGARTAAANRLQAHGKARDWDAEEPEAEAWQDPLAVLPSSPWDELPEDDDLPEAL
jgi:hypothetical protein